MKMKRVVHQVQSSLGRRWSMSDRSDQVVENDEVRWWRGDCSDCKYCPEALLRIARVISTVRS